MSLKIKVGDFASASKKIKDAIGKIVENAMDNGALNRLGKIAVDSIRLRTRLGYGVSDNGAEKEILDGLAKSTIYKRTLMKKRGDLSPLTTAKKSNLTMTGQMLDAIEFVAKKLGIIITIKNSSRRDSRATNKQIAIYNEEKGRPFFYLSSSEQKKIKSEAAKIIKEKLKQGLTKF